MITIEFKDDDLRALQQALSTYSTEEALPNTSAALDRAAQIVKDTWSEWASGNQALPEIGKNPKPSVQMAKSIKISKNGEWSRTISSNNRQMEQLANGSPAVEYDMKKTHPYGKKSRVSKKGIPYLIIPFRWGTPNEKGTKRAHFANFIPQAEYETGANVKSFKRSWITQSLHKEKNFHGEDIDRQEYQWKDRLTKETAWDDRSVGMVRMRSTGRGKPGTYFTFRIISAKSPHDKWIYRKPEEIPIDIIKAVETATTPFIESMIENGLKKDVGY